MNYIKDTMREKLANAKTRCFETPMLEEPFVGDGVAVANGDGVVVANKDAVVCATLSDKMILSVIGDSSSSGTLSSGSSDENSSSGDSTSSDSSDGDLCTGEPITPDTETISVGKILGASANLK